MLTMRLSGGAKARRSLAAPKGVKTRPTSAKVREALFVDADDWKEKVYARTADFTLKAYRGLSS